MKRIVALVLVIVLLLSLSSCGKIPFSNTSDSTSSDALKQDETAQGTNPTLPTSQEIQPEEYNCSADAIVGWMRRYSAENNLNPVTDLEIKAGEKAGQTVTSFKCMNDLVAVSVTETGGIVDNVMAVCLPSAVANKVSSNSLAEAAIGAYAYCMIPLFACEPKIADTWHQEQFANAPDEGNSSIIIRSYTSELWVYTAMVGESFVSCVACRYCSQCKDNAPNVLFTSNSAICDNCKYGNQGSGNTAGTGNTPTGAGNGNTTGNATGNGNTTGGNTGGSGNTPNSGNSTGGGNTPSGGNTSPQPTVCSHNYASATCTAPETCTLCGERKGYALGHDYSPATCKAPQTCKRCSATIGTVASHRWKAATCTMPETCVVCYQIGKEAKGHQMLFTKCTNSSCDYVDYSGIAGVYTNIGAYGYAVGTTKEIDVEVSNVSVSDSGTVSFTAFNKNFTISIQQNDSKSDRFMAYFYCYLNGELLEDVTFRVGSESYDNRIYLAWFVVDGCEFYWHATR